MALISAKRILFVLVIAAVMALLTTTPPIAARTAEPFRMPSVPTLDVEDEAEKIADSAAQIVGWLLGNNDKDNSEKQDTASQM